jgi:RNA polymerase sigma factor for flagellar operon FliA
MSQQLEPLLNEIKDIKDFNSLIVKYMDFVKRIAYHLIGKLPKSIQVDDLIQSGMIGLIEAAKNYNTEKGASFETYAGIRVRGAMLDEIRRGDWAPRSVHRNARKISQAIREIENRMGRDAKDHEVAEHLNVGISEYHQMLKDTSGTRLFAFDDIMLSRDDIEYLGEFNTIPNPFENLQKSDFQKTLAEVIAELPEKERLVLALYYDEDLNLREVGDVLGVSESRISQIHSQAMLRIQARLSKVPMGEVPTARVRARS